MKRYLYYCPSCKMRFQNQNFGYGYPKLNSEGAALCPYCEMIMAETLGEAFPAEWVEERPSVQESLPEIDEDEAARHLRVD